MPDAKAKRIDFGSDDLIGKLPDGLLSHILSFLPTTKDAATTSVISKQWRFLFAFASKLQFSSPIFSGSDSSVSDFMDFVDRVLSVRGDAVVNKLSLALVEDVDGDRATGWILSVLKRGVSDLEIETYDLLNWSGPPPDVFAASKLVRLKLGMGDERIIGQEVDINLPSLKTLHLDDVQFEGDCTGLLKLLSGCPVLEELIMEEMNWYDWEVCCVYSATLKRLEICWYPYDEDEHRNGCPKTVTFDTPNLQYLEYTDDHVIKGLTMINTGKKKYPVMKFESLVGAKISLTLRSKVEQEEEEENVAGDAIDFLQGICNVKNLFLCSDTLKVLTFCGGQIPVFNRLSLLQIQSGPKVGWESLPALLGNCPDLETLVFKGLSHRCGDISGTLPSTVKKLFIFEAAEDEEDNEDEEEENPYIHQVKKILETMMPNLEELTIYCQASVLVEMIKACSQISTKYKTIFLLDQP